MSLSNGNNNNTNYNHSQSGDENGTSFHQSPSNSSHKTTYQQPHSYHDSEFDTQSLPNHIFYTPQWHVQSSGSQGNAIPSPSPSIQDSEVVSHHILPGRNMSQPGLISPSPTGRVFPSVNHSRLNPALNNYLQDVEPWNPMLRRSDNPGNPINTNINTYLQPGNPSFLPNGPGSETARSLPDSGYVTHPPPYSDPGHTTHELTPGLTYVTVHPALSDTNTTDRSFYAPSNSNSRTRGARRPGQIACTICPGTSKCASDHKKHMLRHNKKFKCTVPGCRRAGKGFGTSNDLDRHQKSVHGIGATQNSWKCASDNCRNKEKIWPRLDNFKQHIHRMHRDEDEAEIIRSSVYHESSSDVIPRSFRPPSLDTALAGIGDEKQGTSNEFDEPASGISLTPDQAPIWHFYNSRATTDASMVPSQILAIPQIPTTPNELLSTPAMLPHHGKRGQDPSPYPGTAADSRNRSTETNSLETLHLLAEVASSQPQRAPQRIPELSNAPQTKSAQAIHKLTRIIHGLRNSRGRTVDDQASSAQRPVYMDRTKSNSTSSSGSSQSQCSEDLLGSQNMQDDKDHEDKHEVHDQGFNQKEVITDKDLYEVSLALRNLIRRPARHRPRPSGMSTFNTHKCDHEGCDSAFARACELRKHMKRHTKPYGCTFPQCNKRFGSKSDWKRHERDQHFQAENYVCQFVHHPGPGKAADATHQCLTYFGKEQLFRKHYKDEHGETINGKDDARIKASKIGKNHLNTFWCGFCKKIIVLKEKLTKGWAERFDHIDGHFKTQKIEEWFCPEAGCMKGERDSKVESEPDETSSESEDMDDGRDQVDKASVTATATQAISNAMRRPRPNAPSNGLSERTKQRMLSLPGHVLGTISDDAPPSSAAPSLSVEAGLVPKAHPRKRPHGGGDGEDYFHAESSHSPAKRTKTFNTYCCECFYGPLTWGTHMNCLTCPHRLCRNCPTRSESVNMDEEWEPQIASYSG